MESKRKNESLEQENLLLLLDQLVKEQEQMSKSLQSITEILTSLSNKSNEAGSNLKSVNVATLADDLKETSELIKKATIRIETAKTTERKFQVLLFPPQDARLFYKIVLGRWFIYMQIGLTIEKVYSWKIHQANSDMKLKIETMKENTIIKAWHILYNEKNKSLHKLMDMALFKAV